MRVPMPDDRPVSPEERLLREFVEWLTGETWQVATERNKGLASQVADFAQRSAALSTPAGPGTGEQEARRLLDGFDALRAAMAQLIKRVESAAKPRSGLTREGEIRAALAEARAALSTPAGHSREECVFEHGGHFWPHTITDGPAACTRCGWTPPAPSSREEADGPTLCNRCRIKSNTTDFCDDCQAVCAAWSVVDSIAKIATGARSGPRHGVTEREAALYDKGYDDALDHVRSAIHLLLPSGSVDG